MSIIYTILKGFSRLASSARKVHPYIYQLDFRIANAFIVISNKNQREQWVLIDTGLESSGDFIKKKAEELFNREAKPKAIILTHGHFDHVGSVRQLIEAWNVPVYAHPREFPYLTGEKDYPKADPTIDKGVVSQLSPQFPHQAIDISFNLFALPKDGSVPFLPNFRWIHTPGHTEGHISLYNETDGILIAGDAFTTLRQESVISVLTSKEEIDGPPSYLTQDFSEAASSIRKLRDLNPKLALVSHGKPMSGESLHDHLDLLVSQISFLEHQEESRY